MTSIKSVEQYILIATINRQLPDAFTKKGFHVLVKWMLAEYLMQA